MHKPALSLIRNVCRIRCHAGKPSGEAGRSAPAAAVA